MHLGHAKAYIAEPNFAMDSPEGEKLTQQREMLIKGHVACLNYALKFGYVYKRWYTIVHGILKKDIGLRPRYIAFDESPYLNGTTTFSLASSPGSSYTK